MARILLVEDHDDVRLVTRLQLEGAGHDVMAVCCGEDALALADGATPDVAIVDVVMPGMSGFELAPALRARAGLGELPVIFLTGRTEARDVEAAQALGARYLAKPFVGAALLAAVDAAMAPAASASSLPPVL